MKVMTKTALAAIDTVGILFEDYDSGHWGRSLVRNGRISDRVDIGEDVGWK
jgi:hypothetical protein